MLPTWLFLFCVAAVWWGLKSGRMLATYWVASVFGASAALSVVLMGGAPVTPALFCVPFLMWASIRERGLGTWLGGLSWREPGVWLGLFVAWSVFTAVFFPRLFEGQVLVYTTSRADSLDLGVKLTWLAPNTTNVTQSIYLVCGLLVFLCFRSLALHREHRAWFLKGLYVAACINVFLVLVDFVSVVGRIELGLTFIRNANYAIVSQAVGSWPRLQGSFPEPSALAGFTVLLVGLLLALWLQNVDRRVTGVLGLLNSAALLLTLSSTAFISFGAVCLFVFLSHLLRQPLAQARLKFGWQSALMLVLVFVAGVLALWTPSGLERFLEIVHVMLFEKVDSESGQERWSWVVGSWNNFLATYGLGVGLGSARGSSFMVVVLGNVGVLGAILMVMFLLLTLLGRIPETSTEREFALVRATRIAMLGGLVSASLAGTNVDLGGLFFGLAGFVAGLMKSAAEEQQLSPVQESAFRPQAAM